MTLVSDLAEGRSPTDPTYFTRILEGARQRRFEARAGWEFYRARVMPLERELAAEPLECAQMGAPPPGSAAVGRMQKVGQSFLYAALEKETALAEVRPWLKARITVSRFLSTTTLNVADLTGTRAMTPGNPAIEFLSYMLGRPTHRDDTDTYLPSQQIAERLAGAGFDAIFYDSAQRRGGINAVLFDVQSVECQEPSELYEVSDLTYATAKLYPDDA